MSTPGLRAWAALCALALVSAPGCGDDAGAPKQPITTAEVAPLSAAHLRAFAAAWRDGAAWLSDASFAGEVGGMFDDVVEPVDGEPVDGEAGDDGVDQTLDTLADALEQEVFIDDNVVSDDGTTIVYQVPLSAACRSDEDRAECEATWSAHPIQLRVVSYNEGELVLGVLVGSPPIEAATVTLGPTRLGVSMNVAAAMQIAELVGEADDEDVEVDSASGRVAMWLERPRDRALTLRGGVEEPIALRASSNGRVMDLTFGRSSTVITIDGAERVVDLSFEVGGVTLAAPLAFFSDPEDGDVPNTTVGLDFPGASAAMTLDEDASALVIERVSLGSRQTALKIGGNTVFGIDLNRSAGRAVDVTLTRVGDAREVSVSPSLELALTVAMRHVASLQPGFDAGWAADETMSIRLDGAAAPTLRMHDDGRTEVVAGRLTMDSTARNDVDVTVEAGQCLLEDETFGEDEADDDAHPFEAFSAGTCAP